MTTLADVIAAHSENYDSDCSYHAGCSCEWSSPVFVYTEDQDEDGHDDYQLSSDAWAVHAAEKVAEFVRDQARQEAEGYAGHLIVHALTRFGDKFYNDNKETK